MTRANRHYIPEQVWHITHRCHKREFLLKFLKDRERWIQWLFEAKKRYGLQVLDFTVTSNHIHLLVIENAKDVVSKSLQLIAGITAQEFNRRKKERVLARMIVITLPQLKPETTCFDVWFISI